MRTKVVFVVLLLIALISGAPWIYSKNVQLDWSPIPDAVGYKIYYGIESHKYTDVIEIGPAPSYSVRFLNRFRTHHFTVAPIYEITFPELDENGRDINVVRQEEGPLSDEIIRPSL